MTTESSQEVRTLSHALCVEALERICSSTELKRATRLRDFLRYVGLRSLEPSSPQISEQEIGINVFERRDSYDTSADNIVRVNASELRKRIAAYYATEGIHESILLEIPLRSYTPVFSLRAAEPDNGVAPAKPVAAPDFPDTGRSAPAAQASATRPRPLLYFAFALSLVLAAACLYFFQQDRALQNQLYGWKSNPTLGPFWTGILESPLQTDVVIADSSFSQVEDFLKRPISLNDYLNHRYTDQIQSSNLNPELKNYLQIVSSRDTGSLGDFHVAQKIINLDPLSKRLHLQYARDFQPHAIRTDNVILIGSNHSNPWCSLFQDRLNFILDYDSDRGEMLVTNRNPAVGESAVYVTHVDPNSYQGYGIIDYIPNNSRTANVLIIAGTTAEATEAAGEFITTEETLHRFQDQLHVRTIPYFELLLKTTKLLGTPMSAQIIGYRTFPDPPIDSH